MDEETDAFPLRAGDEIACRATGNDERVLQMVRAHGRAIDAVELSGMVASRQST